MNEAMSEPVYEGGCLCGAVRYRARGPVLSAPYCHCTICRRASGAPVVAWGTFTAAGFAFTAGVPARYASSATATRQFCPRCGSALTFQFHDRPEEIDVTLATLDDPAAVAPTHHTFVADRLPWLRLADDLPRYPGFRSA
jgi:hypothetical protein